MINNDLINVFVYKKNMSWHINIIILKTMQQTRTFFCVCPPFFFFMWLEYPFKAVSPDRAYLLPRGGFVTLSILSLQVFFRPPPSFLLSCLSLVFFPVCLPLTALLYLSCFTLPPPLSAPFSASPPVHLTPAPFPFPCIFLSHVLVFALSQARRRRSSWLLSQPSLFTCWPAMEWSCRWLGQSPSLCPSRLTVAWRKMITSLLGDLTRA